LVSFIWECDLQDDSPAAYQRYIQYMTEITAASNQQPARETEAKDDKFSIHEYSGSVWYVTVAAPSRHHTLRPRKLQVIASEGCWLSRDRPVAPAGGCGEL
jgi:hypothetical protein